MINSIKQEKSLQENKSKIDQKINKYKSKIDTLTNINQNLEKNNSFNQYISSERQYLIDKDQQRIHNPLMPPERSFPHRISSMEFLLIFLQEVIHQVINR